MKRRVGFVTIGQSPRTDVTSDIMGVLGSDIEVVECGALDELTEEQIKSLAPVNEDFFVTRLRNGREVRVSVKKIVTLVQGCVKKIEPLVDIVAIICTGEFPPIESSKPLVKLSTLIESVTRALSVKRLGVIIPDPRQSKMVYEKWKSVAQDVKIASASPYTGSEEELVEAARQMLDRDLVVLDCIGYTTRAKKVVAEVAGKPVLLPRSLLARVLRDLVEV